MTVRNFIGPSSGGVAVVVLAAMLLVAGPVRADMMTGTEAPPIGQKDAAAPSEARTELGEWFKALIAEAVRRHPALAAVNAQTAEREQEKDIRFSDFLPQIDGGPTLINHHANPPLVIGLADRRVDAQLMATQLIYDFGATYDRLDAAVRAVQASQTQYEGLSNSYILKAVQTYFDVIRYRQLEAGTKHYLSQIHELQDDIKLRASSGVGSQSEVLRARSREADALSRVSVYQDRRERAEAQYIEIFGEAPGDIALPHIKIDTVEGAPTDRLVGQALERNPTLLRQKLLTDAARLEASAAEEDLWPKFRIEASGTKYSVVGGVSTNYDIDYSIQLRMIYRLYSGGAETAKAHLAAEKYHEQMYQTDTAARELERDVRLAVADLQNTQRRISVLELAHDADVETVAAYLEQFKANRVKFTDILDAQREATNSSLQLTEGNLDLELAKYNVMALTGDLVPFFGLDKKADGLP